MYSTVLNCTHLKWEPGARSSMLLAAAGSLSRVLGAATTRGFLYRWGQITRHTLH